MKSTPIIVILLASSGVGGAIYRHTSEGRGTEIAKSFEKFSPLVKTHSDAKNFYVESNGMPEHPLMVGIRAWQQQVPLPQNYSGDNAWQFPLFPVESKEKLSAKDHFFRGAIAIAADGVPIFNPIKNDGITDTYLAGELDDYGGHSGRGDDYHYHLAPIFLQSKIGKSLPIAYALDGYPIYGYDEPDSSAPKGLDSFNGHSTSALGYHYHATKSYPYLNGGFHGVVLERDGQVDPQPRAKSPRPATSPLRGAKITGFQVVKPGSYSLSYTIGGQTGKVNYQVTKDGSVQFDFIDTRGMVDSKTYRYGRDGGENPEGKKQREQGQGKPGDGHLGPPPGPRKPWLADHFTELDTTKDRIVTLEEVFAQCKDAFKQYAQGKDSIDVSQIANLPTVKLAIGGFMKVHAKELDTNGDGKMTEQEVIDTMTRMFKKQDKNGDGKLTLEEANAEPRRLGRGGGGI